MDELNNVDLFLVHRPNYICNYIRLRLPNNNESRTRTITSITIRSRLQFKFTQRRQFETLRNDRTGKVWNRLEGDDKRDGRCSENIS